MDISTLNAVLQMKASASKDPHRPHLCGVLIQSDGKKINLKATDGKCLAETELEDSGPGGQWFASLEDLNLIKTLVKALPRHHTDIVTTLGAYDELRLEFGTTVVALLKDKNYPDTSGLATTPKVPFSVSLNPELLLNLLKSVRIHKRQDGVTLTFDALNPMGPIAVCVGTGGAGLLMPMRLDDVKTKGHSDDIRAMYEARLVALKELVMS